MVDLHTHTHCSDGTLTPSELVREAAQKGLLAVAITDHDTIAGNAEAIAEGVRCGVTVVPGIEISSEWGGFTFHLVGLGLCTDDPALGDTLRFLEESRNRRAPLMVEKIRSHGCDISLAEVEQEADGALVGRPHIARVLLRKGCVETVQEAFDRYLGRGKAGYVDKARLGAADACGAVLAAGGVPVLAHPGLVERDRPGALPGLLDHLAANGLGGIEAYYSRHTAGQTRRYRALARERGLMVSGGSDFHGPFDGGPALGTGLGALSVPDECFDELLRRLDAKQGRGPGFLAPAVTGCLPGETSAEE